MAVAAVYGLNSEILRIPIPQKGQEQRTLDLTIPARWNEQTKLDDSGAVWDFIQRLDQVAGVMSYDVSLTAESSDGRQNVDYSGALDGGYDAQALKSIADKLQEIVNGGSLRMAVGSLSFPPGQPLLDWLKANNRSFNLGHITQ